MDYPLNTKIKSLILRIPYSTKSVAEIVAMSTESLSDSEKEILLENISTQLSEGWGDSFEQREITSYEDKTTSSKVSVYGQFWWNNEVGSHKWYIKYI